MSNTIELLNNIGSDASLRHASSENLQKALSGMHASDGLKQAAMAGDKSYLAAELGSKANMAVETSNNPHESSFTYDEDEDSANEDAPERDVESGDDNSDS